ncbi:type II toxin-antitoxin system RelE/ParE family toxin [Mesorhizobium australicum]|uniref:Toxin n=1 Tax=Mesorhizobium australicum TaxID=536018 RepID=A0A1X7PH81_9HYPH|nr:type II toxin-antitoxin system RelE/ParE family toxin [Mesorhizobium australicum]SMH50688.1 toxin ParE1/3/4 [Mesorhizobium australicum]
MKRALRLRPAARKDIREIWDYTSRTWSRAKANEYVRMLTGSLNVVDVNPGLARPAGIGEAGLRKFVAGSHVLYFHIEPESIDVVRILHGSMDPKLHL